MLLKFVVSCTLCLHFTVNSFSFSDRDIFHSDLTMTSSTSDEIDTEEREGITPRWCPEQQIYVGGVVPSDNADVERLLDDNNGHLRIFGYGSLCWNPGKEGALSKADEGVTQTLGRAVGWRRCWAQRSADHRGTPSFLGLVCTLLADDEVAEIRRQMEEEEVAKVQVVVKAPSLTEGVIYTVPPHLVKECLEELDFREKGGYERDVIDVIEDDTGKTVQALLYRGSPDNPAFWPRALLDLKFAAAVMSVAVGPSGPNCDYLFNLDHFLTDAAKESSAAAASFEDHTGDADTVELARMARSFREKRLFFLVGCGSNQYNQLLLTKAAGLKNGDEARDMKEIVLAVHSSKSHTDEISTMKPKKVFCGGGHSALLTEDGTLYLWGWNTHGQLGQDEDGTVVSDDQDALTVVTELKGIEKAALGHSHTLVIESDTGRLLAFGDNARGQVDGTEGGQKKLVPPIQLKFARDGEKFVDIAAGVFHSAAINSEGELITFGCRRFGQCLHHGEDHSKVAVGRWRPEDGSRLVKVAAGHRHTLVLDEHGRVYAMGNNKHGQLGKKNTSKKGAAQIVPHLVDGPLGQKGSGCIDIGCGWSHNSALIVQEEASCPKLWGWGRNDKGQLGTKSYESVDEPQLLHKDVDGNPIDAFACGSESTMVLDTNGNVYQSGWNEHGNLGIGTNEDVCCFAKVRGARATAPPPSDGRGKILIAAGGAHCLAVKL